MKKMVLASLLSMISLQSMAAEVTIGCVGKNLYCNEKIQTALNRIGCNPTAKTVCFENTIDNKSIIVCRTPTQNCENARTNIFYNFECRDGAKEVRLSDFEDGLTANFETTVLGKFKSGFICIR